MSNFYVNFMGEIMNVLSYYCFSVKLQIFWVILPIQKLSVYCPAEQILSEIAFIPIF